MITLQFFQVMQSLSESSSDVYIAENKVLSRIFTSFLVRIMIKSLIIAQFQIVSSNDDIYYYLIYIYLKSDMFI